LRVDAVLRWGTARIEAVILELQGCEIREIKAKTGRWTLEAAHGTIKRITAWHIHFLPTDVRTEFAHLVRDLGVAEGCIESDIGYLRMVALELKLV